MTTLPEDKLREIATADASQRLKSVFTKAEFTLAQSSARTEWDPTLRRHIFHSTIQAWRDFDQIEFVVSPEGRVKLFRDKNRLEPRGPAEPPLTSADLLAIAATTGEVGPTARIEVTPTPAPLVTFTVRQSQPGMPIRIRFIVNAGLRQVAAMEVLPDPIELPGAPQAPGLPEVPGAPDAALPKMPQVNLPKVTAPKLSIPEVKFP